MKFEPRKKWKYLRLPSVFFWKPNRRHWIAIFKGMLGYLITSYLYMITPVTNYFGSLGYLGILMAIFTPPFLPLGSHLESFALATLGMVFGLGSSAIGMACFTTANRNIGVPSGRWIAFSFMLVIAFLFGYGKARFPKLAVFWTVGFIPPLYLFTIHIDVTHFSFIFPCKFIILQLIGCLIMLAVNFIFWPVGSTALVCNTMVSVLAQTRDILLKLPDALKTTDYDEIQSYQLEIKIRQIQATMYTLTDKFRQARYEVTYGKIDPRLIVRSVGTLVKLQHHLRILLKSALDGQRIRKDSATHRNASIELYGVNGGDVGTLRNDEQFIKLDLDILTEHTPELIHVASVAINRLISAFEVLSDQGQPTMALPPEKLPHGVDSEVATLQLLEDALEKYKQIHTEVSEELHAASEGSNSNDPIMIASAYMYALRQVLVSVQQIVESQEELKPNVCKRKRLWWPKVTFSKWLQTDARKEKEIRGHKVSIESEVSVGEDDQDDMFLAATREERSQSCPPKHREVKEEKQEGQAQEVGIRARLMSSQVLSVPVRKQSIGTFLYQVQKEKENRRTFRLQLWKLLRWCKSNEVVYAFKFTIIFSCLSLPAYFDSSMKWYSEHHGQWSLITANIVSNVSIGAVLTIGVQRFIGTILGGLWGLAVWEISRGNQYALPVCFTLCSFPLWYLFVHNPLNKVGSVSLAAYVVVIFNEWVYRRTETNFSVIALKRIAAVDTGILMTFLVHSLISPYIARVELRLELSHIFSLNTFVLSSLFNLHHETEEEDRCILRDLRCNFTKVYHSLLKSQALFDKSSAEPRLRGPFQRDVYEEILIRLKHMLDLTLVIRNTLNQLPQEYLDKYMIPINEYRREMVSILILNLYNVSGALRTKSPMPRYLPSVTGIRQILCDFVLKELPPESRSSFELTTYYTYSWALLEYSIEEEIIIELVKGIVGETKLNIRLDSTRIAPRPNQIMLFQSKQPHQMKYD